MILCIYPTCQSKPNNVINHSLSYSKNFANVCIVRKLQYFIVGLKVYVNVCLPKLSLKLQYSFIVIVLLVSQMPRTSIILALRSSEHSKDSGRLMSIVWVPELWKHYCLDRAVMLVFVPVHPDLQLGPLLRLTREGEYRRGGSEGKVGNWQLPWRQINIKLRSPPAYICYTNY